MKTKIIPYLIKQLLDFIELIKYLNDSKDGKQEVQIEIKDDAKLYDIVEKLKDLTSDNFIKLFKDNDGLTLNKIISIFEYFLKIINECVISDISEQQDNDIDEDVKNKLDNYFQNKHLLKKEDLAYAIKLFMALVLFLEDDKENKIKSNSNNIVNYLKTTDLWKYDINDETFINDLNDLKSLNIKINQIISFYQYLIKDFNDDNFDDVEKKINAENNSINDEIPDDEDNDNVENVDDDDDRL